MTGWTLFFVTVGVSCSVSWLFKLIDHIEGVR